MSYEKFKHPEEESDQTILENKIRDLSLEDRLELVSTILDSEHNTEKNYRAAIVAQSSIAVELMGKVTSLTDENNHLRTLLHR